MDKAKAAVGDFLSKAGTHHTEIHESANAPVIDEHVKPVRHEEILTAVDKETHQDHYHTTIQPIEDREVLPEKHHHTMQQVEHRHIEHDKPEEVKLRLERERAQFQHSSTTHETQHTQKIQPTVGGERVHHHVHETVQPVIHKETIQPEVIHTTVPIHETHHNAARIHEAHTLPTMSMSEFKKVGGSLTGNETRHTERDGCPDPSNPAGFTAAGGDHHHGHHHGQHGSGIGGNNDTLDGSRSGLDRTEADLGQRGTGSSGLGMGTGRHHDNTTGSGLSGSGRDTGLTGSGRDTGLTGSGRDTGDYRGTSNPLGSTSHKNSEYDSSTTGTGQTHKPSLMDKLNPKVDSNGDGKAGFMK